MRLQHMLGAGQTAGNHLAALIRSQNRADFIHPPPPRRSRRIDLHQTIQPEILQRSPVPVVRIGNMTRSPGLARKTTGQSGQGPHERRIHPAAIPQIHHQQAFPGCQPRLPKPLQRRTVQKGTLANATDPAESIQDSYQYGICSTHSDFSTSPHAGATGKPS